MNMPDTLSVIIVARDEERKIGGAIKSAKWADEVLVVDHGSNDKTASISEKGGARVITITRNKSANYSRPRNIGLKEAIGGWVLYLDADERITPKLKKELRKVITSDSEHVWYVMPRINVILGREMKHGGWWPDYVKRLYSRGSLKKWKGKLHEEPSIEGEPGYLSAPLRHLKHDNLSDMVDKTNEWSEIEAKLLYDSGHPKMSWWRFVRVMITELWLRLIQKRGFLDGVEGIMYSVYQSWSKFVTYAKLWEMQVKAQDSKVKT